jgi:hypothetical protein
MNNFKQQKKAWKNLRYSLSKGYLSFGKKYLKTGHCRKIGSATHISILVGKAFKDALGRKGEVDQLYIIQDWEKEKPTYPKTILWSTSHKLVGVSELKKHGVDDSMYAFHKWDEQSMSELKLT